MLTLVSMVAFLASAPYLAKAYEIAFYNNCPYTVWPAVGDAPNGQPNQSIKYGTVLGPQGRASYGVSDTAIGVRAWGRTGCDSNGANCQTGACNGGLTCTDAGITAKALFSEYGYGSNNREYWDLSFVGGTVNIPAKLQGPDGQVVECLNDNCPTNQAFHTSGDYGAIRNSAPGGTYTHTFCP